MSAFVLRKVADRAPTWLIKELGNLWSPYLGAGIKVEKVSSNYRYLKVSLKKRWYNLNYVGTHFGGSIYAMVDPFYMLMLINNLGKEYIVWDKAAVINFLKPGRSDLYAEFVIDEDLLDDIRSETALGDKFVFDLPVQVFDKNGELIADIEKTLYVRRKI
jgi:acyl-coenzyme A thioesterase PaaI-like protein